MIVSGLNACYPRVLLQEVSPARDKCRGEVSEPGTQAVGRGSFDVGDGVVR